MLKSKGKHLEFTKLFLRSTLYSHKAQNYQLVYYSVGVMTCKSIRLEMLPLRGSQN